MSHFNPMPTPDLPTPTLSATDDYPRQVAAILAQIIRDYLRHHPHRTIRPHLDEYEHMFYD